MIKTKIARQKFLKMRTPFFNTAISALPFAKYLIYSVKITRSKLLCQYQQAYMKQMMAICFMQGGFVFGSNFLFDRLSDESKYYAGNRN